MSYLLLPLAGGALIGLSSLAMLGLLGRITGISGIYGSVITSGSDNGWRWAFLAGLILGPSVFYWLSATPPPLPSNADLPLTLIAGLLVGLGTRLGGGCTSGHGVCGIGRMAPRSLAATATFIGIGMLTVFIGRHLYGT
jgi:uncharacterized membrane protein YedE/YeeE